ncbi:MAG: hypothetical protein ACI814_001987, partial [Mariniblastus sp.]
AAIILLAFFYAQSEGIHAASTPVGEPSLDSQTMSHTNRCLFESSWQIRTGGCLCYNF